MNTEELSFGEKAVGISFNPSNNREVNIIKSYFAHIIDTMDELRNMSTCSRDTARLASVAITEAQTAQMWAVKALTWKDA